MADDAIAPVLVRADGQVTVISLNAPAKLNAISTEMRTQLRTAMETAIADPGCRAIVLTGEGGIFSSGADVGQMQSGGEIDMAHVRMRYQILHDVVRLIHAGPKPVIAAVEGYAYGAGLSLAAACDFMVVSETAKFGAAFGKIGFIGDCGLLWTLPQRIGAPRTRDFMFGMKSLSGREALDVHLADALVAGGEALAAAKARALAYAQGAPLAIAHTKALMARNFADLSDFLQAEGAAQELLVRSQDHHEGRTAFAEKRPPVFKGR